MTGTKLIILAAAIFAGVLAHYGYPTNQVHWFYRDDLSWAGNFGLYWATFMTFVGFMKKD